MNTSTPTSASISLAIVGALAALLIAGLFGEFSRVGRALPISGLMLMLVFLYKPLIGVPFAVAVLLIAYLGWFRPVSTGRVHYTTMTWLTLAGLSLLSASWYRFSWADGLQWQGSAYTTGCAVIGALLFAGALAAGLAARMFQKPAAAVLGRWLAFLWAVTYGYPWLGELL